MFQISHFKFHNKDSAGFTMIELIITIAILSFAVIGVYGAFSLTSTLTFNISSRFTAAYLAHEGFEIVRNLRDNNFISSAAPQPFWSYGLTGCATGCQLDYKTGTAIQGPENLLAIYDPNNFLKLNSDGFYSYDTCPTCQDTKFKRKITISPISGTSDALKVAVLVEWNYNGKSFSFETNGYLYNWY